MKWIDIFKIYSLKKIKTDKLLFIFTAISILISTSISLIIPVMNVENQKYIEDNLIKINGGDLSIVIRGNQPNEFYYKLNEIKEENFEIKDSTIQNCYYEKDSNYIMGRIAIGDYSLKDDEIILQSTLAHSLNVKIGDYIELDTRGNGKFKYKVKAIETLASAVDRDAKLLGYGKVNKKSELENIKGTTFININGEDAKGLKEDLVKINPSNEYKTAEDVGLENRDETMMQKVVLSILSTLGYVFSALAIISTTLMIIMKRKKDIAILKLLSFKSIDIKKAFLVEFSIWILAPILISGLASYLSIKWILEYGGIIIENISAESFLLMLKGILFNGLIFLLLILIALKVIDGIKGMSIVREDERETKRQNKRILIFSIFIIPVLLILYSIYCGTIENIGGVLIIISLLLIFLIITSITIKVFSKLPFKSNLIFYSFKAIRNRFFSFVLILMSLTLTLWFILIGFNLEASIKNNYKSSLESILPYNYYIEGKDSIEIEKTLKSNNVVEGFIKSSSIDGKILNEKFNDRLRVVTLNEINKEDYGVSYNILYGEDLFQGEDGVLVTDDLRDKSAINLGDILEIETEKGIIKERVKGVYKSGGINTLAILKENVSLGKDIGFLVEAKNTSFMEDLKNSTVVAVSDMGDRMAVYISSFLKVFRVLSIICFLGTILFNINMVFMNCSKDERDEEILIALGYNKDFIIKSQLVKMAITIMLASVLSLGVYGLIIKFFFAMMIKASGEISIGIIVINILLSIIITIVSFAPALRNIRRKKELNLLREEA